ncbi:rod-binding protein [Anianabacter salinae]|uniref:rod-binding protein n=1 Tax=Anianabacter salinae TaxID=2851023 RepID=UPI00225DF6FE|nr:rod-binding protein [Anianabacter salinae]MBV0913440.1 rod-binding protein [Anianabacter salinae]
MISPSTEPGARATPHTAQEARLMDVARQVESQFLSAMLKDAGLGAVPSAFGGGAGEDQFASLLRNAQADTLVQAGGIGLAEVIFRSLVARSNAEPPG